MTDALLLSAIAITISVACMIMLLFNANDLKREKSRMSELAQQLNSNNQLFLTTGKEIKDSKIEIHHALSKMDTTIREALATHDVWKETVIHKFELQKDWNVTMTAFSTGQISFNKKAIDLINEFALPSPEQTLAGDISLPTINNTTTTAS